MTNVSGGECRPPRGNDARDFHVTGLYRVAGRAATRRPSGGLSRRRLVEGQDASVEIVFEGPREGLFQLVPSPAGRQQLETEANLEHGD